jgi:hypothetical protein
MNHPEKDTAEGVVPASYIRLGIIRHREGIRAETFLGVPKRQLFFLCFPDMKTLDIATDPNPEQVQVSPKTHLRAAEYSFAFMRDAPYSGSDRHRETGTRYRKSGGGHPPGPSWSTQPYACRPAAQQVLLSYLIHFPHWPEISGRLHAGMFS